MDEPAQEPRENPLPIYHAGELPNRNTGPRPLWCVLHNPPVLTEREGPHYRCPECRRLEPGPDFVATPENWPEAFPGRRAAEKAAAKAKEPVQHSFKLKF